MKIHRVRVVFADDTSMIFRIQRRADEWLRDAIVRKESELGRLIVFYEEVSSAAEELQAEAKVPIK